MINAPTTGNIRKICIDNNLRLIEHATKRVGRPRINWWLEGLTEFWKEIRQESDSFRNSAVDLANELHTTYIKTVASSRKQARL